MTRPDPPHEVPRDAPGRPHDAPRHPPDLARRTPELPRSVLRRPPAPLRPAGATAVPAPRLPVRRERPRRPLPTGVLAVVLLLVGLFAVAAGLGQATGFRLPNPFRAADKPPPRAFPVLEPSRPMRLEIPAIKVKAPVTDVGLAADGSVGVPPPGRHNEAGWFERGPTPGQFGPAVIVGHVDSRTGPSVFHDLGKLKPGQRIEVVRRDRRVAVFEVNSVEHFAKAKLPVDRVYGDFSRPSLRLVTCGGRWVGGGAGYSDNVIVFASLVSSRRA